MLPLHMQLERVTPRELVSTYRAVVSVNVKVFLLVPTQVGLVVKLQATTSTSTLQLQALQLHRIQVHLCVCAI